MSTPSRPGDCVTLSCGAARAEISLIGAECRTWRAGGLDLIWSPDASVWAATSPILFPIVGRLRDGCMKVDERVYRMNVHGFAAKSKFAATQVLVDQARFRLADDAATRAIYPFSFELIVDYRLSEGALSVVLEVHNVDEAPLPYACGLHPGFRWPFADGAREDYRVAFACEESARVPDITEDGFFRKTARLVPLLDRSLPLSDALLGREALCFLDVESRTFRLVAPSGRAIRVEAENFPHFALWSRPPAPFLCLESWTGYGDPADFDGDVFAKPSMRVLAPGERARHAARYSLE